MIDQFLTYELKVAVLIAVFYIFWRLLVANETWHRLNRIVLIATAIASFVLPFCVITIHQTVEVMPPAQSIPTVVEDFNSATHESGIPDSLQQVEPQRSFNWLLPLTILYIIGVVVVLSRMLLSLWRLHRMRAEGEIHPLSDGYRMAVCEKVSTPFSWWNTVFMNRKDYEEGATALLTHELGHVRLHHSADVLLVELLTALQWFNPAMWMLRADLRTIHEYEADQQVLSHGFNDIQYLQLLIRKAAVQSGYSLANGISNSALKKRVTMIMKPKSNRNSMLKLLALVPIAGICLALNAKTFTDYVYNEPQQLVKKGKANSTIKTNAKDAIKVAKSEEANQTKDEKPFQIDGRVGDKNTGEPIVGAVIRIVGSTKGTVSDKDGRFTLTVKRGDNVEAAYAGYETQTLPVRNYNEIGYHFCFDLVNENTDEENKIYDVVEQMPQYPGGKDKLLQYLSMSIRYPKEAEMAGVQGRVIGNFIVEKDGSITGARIDKSVDKSLDAEALRIINEMPKWKPGMQNGKPVRVKYMVPITFRISGTEVKNDRSLPEKENVLSEVHVMGEDYNASTFSYYIEDVSVDATILKTIDPKTIDHMDVLKKKPGKKAQIRIYTKK